MLPIKMPNGDTPMQYPFPYKNASGEGGSQQSTNPTFVATTTQSLLVTGNAEVDGVLTVATLVADTIGGQRFVGQQNVNSGSITSQTNTSTGNAAFGAVEAKNNTGQILGMYMYGSNHATKPNFAEIQAIGRDLNILASTVSIGTLNCATVTATGVVSGSKFRGEENAAGFSASYQKNSNSAGSASVSVFNNADSDLSLSITGTTSSNKATISTDRPLEIISDSSITLTGTVIANSLSPSLPVSTDASNNLVSASVTGTGSTVLQTSPTLITPTLGAATGTSLQLSGLTASYSVHTDASKNLVSVFNTGSGNNVMSASPTFTGTIQCAGITGSLNWTTTGTLAARTSLGLSGNTSGTVTIACQNTAGTYNFNLPTTSGSSGDVLTSAGGGSSAMTWTGSTGTGNLVRAAGPTLTGTLNCGPVVSTGTVSGTGYVGNSTGLASAGNIGEILFNASTTLTNAVNYYYQNTTAVNVATFGDVLSTASLSAGLYMCVANGYVECQTANRLLQWNFSTGGVRCAAPWVWFTTSSSYVSYSFTKIIRLTATQTITLQGVVNSAATLVDSTNCVCITRIG